MKRLFVAVLEGDSPQTARPIMASEDAAIVRVVARELAKRLTVGNSTKKKPLAHASKDYRNPPEYACPLGEDLCT
jgi:hypothetical protein